MDVLVLDIFSIQSVMSTYMYSDCDLHQGEHSSKPKCDRQLQH